MKIYLASSFLNKYNARQAMNMLENAGHTITMDWTAHKETEDFSVLSAEAIEDIVGVREAEVFVLLFPGRLGSNAELGAALALDKPVILVGGVDLTTSVYYNHPNVRWCATMTDAIDRLKVM